jgi:hypothetical protein
MRWIRTALLHVIVWLTSSAVVIAGLPNVQCRCPSSGTKPASSAPAAKCCCCGVAAADNDDGTPPSCCHPSQTPTKESNEPAFRATDCEKAIVQPHDVTGLNSDKGFQPTNVDASSITALLNIGSEASTVSRQADVAAPPPRNLQLVLQHFLI